MSKTRLKSILKDGTIVLLVSFLLLFSIEGFFSFVIATYGHWKDPRIIAENVTEIPSLAELVQAHEQHNDD